MTAAARRPDYDMHGAAWEAKRSLDHSGNIAEVRVSRRWLESVITHLTTAGDLVEENLALRRLAAASKDERRLKHAMSAFRLPPSATRIILYLFDGGAGTRELIMDALDLMTEGEIDDARSVDTNICKIRRVLGHDLIETIFGRGWALTAAGRARVGELLGEN